jgi:hypothetical protein
MNADQRIPYREGMEAWDHAAVVASFAPHITVHVAVHDEPMQGIEIADYLFSILLDFFEDFHFTDQFVNAERAALVFTTRIRGKQAQGVNLLHVDERGLVDELTVFVRPLSVLYDLEEHVGSRLAAKFGALEE